MEIVLTAVDEALAAAWQQFCGDLPAVRIHRGSILDTACDAVVSPANSFGFMDGGIDALYLRHFGSELQQRVRDMIVARHHGELLVGAADIVETGDARIPFLIVAPTMRVPTVLIESVNPYLAARAVLLLIQHGRFEKNPIRDAVRTLALPGLGTGVGGVSPSTCAHQVRTAIDEVVLGRRPPPRSWTEASERHQLLYTARPRRLQEP
ncbi:MAG TPA: macro domain-containing protein [Bryobacteraceae bacterium]|nr:macro domain-containing protein [Bryobacteraceae bacterium]